MKKIKRLVIPIIISVVLLFAGNNLIAQKIKPVKIGSQTWAKTNLDVSHFANGDAIPQAINSAEWDKAGKEGTPFWCYYNFDPANGNLYGKLYNWYAVNDPRGLAPAGWHVPGDKEWTTLTDFLGGIEAARNKLKSKTGWGDDYNGTDKSKFEALPGGWTTDLFGFDEIGESGFWWTSTEYNNKHALAFLLGTTRGSSNKQDGLSVRCIKD